MASGDISQWVKDARAWTSATKANQAGQTFADAGLPPEVQAVARQISNLNEGMRYGAEDVADQYDQRSAAARQAMLDQFANTDATINAAGQNSRNYMSEIAKRLGLEQVLQGPGVENQRQQTEQMLNMNKVNRTNQLASYDLLKGGYGELLRDRLGSFDVQAGTSLAGILSAIEAAKAAGGSGGGGGGGRGGRGGGGSYSEELAPGFNFMPEQSAFIAMNPYNPPSGSTYSSDYVRPDVTRRPPVPVTKKASRPGTTSRAYSRTRGLGSTSRAASLSRRAKR